MKNITLLLLLITSLSYSQKKKEYYIDEDWKAISKEEFIKKIDHSINIDCYTENDTATFGKLFTRRNYGTIEKENLNKIRQYLEHASGVKIDSTKRLVINYYPGEEEIPGQELSQGSIYHRDYLRKLNKIAPVHNFWVYKNDSNLRYNYGERLPWLHDKDELIETIFFPSYFRYGSFVIIDPEGNYYSYFGEYGKATVWDGMKEFIKKYGN